MSGLDAVHNGRLRKSPGIDSTAVKGGGPRTGQNTGQGATRNNEVVRCRVEASSLAKGPTM